MPRWQVLLVLVVAALFVSVGAGLVYFPAGLITAGLLMAAGGFFLVEVKE